MLRRIIGHRSVQASAAAGATLAVLDLTMGIPWPLWAVWGVASVVAVGQAAQQAARP